MKKSLIAILTAILSFQGLGAKNASFEFTPRIANITENSFTVIFKTSEKSLSWVEIAPNDGSAWYQCKRESFYHDMYGRHFFGKNHYITISGLKPGTSYRYRVIGKEISDDSNPYNMKYGANYAWNPEWGEGNGHSRSLTVRTLDSKAAACTFSMVNDIHFDDAKLASLVNNMPVENDFIVYCGDIVSHCSNMDTVVKHSFKPVEKITSKYPVVYARGNHEGRGADWYKLAEEFPTPNGRFYYTFRQGPAGFIVLDAGEDKPDSDCEYFGTAAFDRYRAEEMEWLKEAVKDPDFVSAPQKICIIHVPTLKNRDSWYCQKWISENFTPILEKAGVKLMLSGHHHRYILSKPGENGCNYTIVVNSCDERLDARIDAGSISLKTYDKSGTLLHELTL